MEHSKLVVGRGVLGVDHVALEVARRFEFVGDPEYRGFFSGERVGYFEISEELKNYYSDQVRELLSGVQVYGEKVEMGPEGLVYGYLGFSDCFNAVAPGGIPEKHRVVKIFRATKAGNRVVKLFFLRDCLDERIKSGRAS